MSDFRKARANEYLSCAVRLTEQRGPVPDEEMEHMPRGPLKNDLTKACEADGFVTARGMFDREKIGLVRAA
jgi:hypothetical protein